MITLLLGGTRSGKSAVAERMGGSYGLTVTYLATALVDPGDANHAARVEVHRTRRPASWQTIECAASPDLIQHLRTSDVVLLDSLGSWLTRHEDFVVDAATLLAALGARQAPTIIVSDEVGMAVHPPTELGRRYVDALGNLNQQVAAISDRVLLVVAGRTLELEAPA